MAPRDQAEGEYCFRKIRLGVWGAAEGLAILPSDKWERRADLTGVKHC